MNIYELLEKDHEVVKDLLNQLLATNSEFEASDLVEKIKTELVPHARAEETVLYNSIRAVDPKGANIFDSYKEHLEAETILRTLQLKCKMGGDWKSSARELQSALLHHIEEEQTSLFSKAQALFSDAEAEQLGSAFERLKPQIKEEGFFKTSLELVMNLMPPRLVGNLNQKPKGLGEHRL